MRTFKHILVPTDFATCSEAAFGAAAMLARTMGASLTLLHVVDASAAGPTGEAFTPQQELLARAEDEARVHLDTEARRRLANGTLVRTEVRTGTAWREIVAAAKASGADLLVMGTHGRTGIARAILGSTTEKVVRMSPVPVLTVHGEEVKEKLAAASSHP